MRESGVQTAWCPEHRIQPIVSVDRVESGGSKTTHHLIVHGDLACGCRYGIVMTPANLAKVAATSG